MVRGGRIIRSKHDVTMWNQDYTCQQTLMRLMKSHKKELKHISIKTAPFADIEDAQSIATLHDLVEYGIREIDGATGVMW